MANKEARVFGKKVEVDVPSSNEWKWEKRPGPWLVGVNQQTGERRRVAVTEVKGRFWLNTLRASAAGEWIVKKRIGSKGGGSDSDLVAQFPGKVRKVLVQTGHQVKEGDALVLIEAMKMEFSIKAPYSGKVKQVRVSEGQQLSPGDVLVDVDRE